MRRTVHPLSGARGHLRDGIMSERIHAYLDGEIPLDALSPEEREHALRVRAALARAVERVAAAPAPDLAGRVMAALPARERAPSPAPWWRRALGWLWTPRRVSFALRPAYGLAGVATAMLALSALHAPRGSVAEAAPEQVAAAPSVYVQFRLEAVGAHQVALAGTFTGWQPRYVMQETAPGVWTALVPLAPGVHDYAFVIDGDQWVADPAAPQVDDDFGGKNSRISLPAMGAAA
jgi:hypothetical protein